MIQHYEYFEVSCDICREKISEPIIPGGTTMWVRHFHNHEDARREFVERGWILRYGKLVCPGCQKSVVDLEKSHSAS